MIDRTLTRRALLHAALPWATLPLALSLRPLRAAAPTSPHGLRAALRVGVLVPAPRDGGADGVQALSQGVALGAEESRRTASLFGLVVEVVTEHSGATRDEALAAVRRLLSAGSAALVCDLQSDHCGPVAEAAARNDAVVANVGPAPDAALAPPCGGRVVHLAPASATVGKARELYARLPGAADTGRATIATWHHTLRRFGAEQLNERFRRRFGAEMTSPAWAGWFAMKILTESALRAQPAAGSDLVRRLLSPGARFDGHKGEPLRFEPRTGELRQPLYVVRGDAVSAEISTGDLWPVSR